MLEFDGIDNFRDFGHYRTGCGRSLHKGRLYRSGHHHRATDRDLARLQDLDIRLIVDLREVDERRLAPSRRAPDFAGIVIENDLPMARTPWPKRLNGAPLTYDWVMQDGLDFYAAAPFEARHLDLFRRFFRAASQGQGAILVHCASGKDRTGLLCALVQHAVGVHRDDITADFLLSNDESRLEQRIAAMRPSVEAAARGPAPDAAMQLAASVHPAYLAAAFEAISAQCGGLDVYLAQMLSVDAAARERLRARLLA